jgi:hypothetical protein
MEGTFLEENILEVDQNNVSWSSHSKLARYLYPVTTILTPEEP